MPRKQAECLICHKSMRADHLTRHKKSCKVKNLQENQLEIVLAKDTQLIIKNNSDVGNSSNVHVGDGEVGEKRKISYVSENMSSRKRYALADYTDSVRMWTTRRRSNSGKEIIEDRICR